MTETFLTQVPVELLESIKNDYKKVIDECARLHDEVQQLKGSINVLTNIYQQNVNPYKFNIPTWPPQDDGGFRIDRGPMC